MIYRLFPIVATFFLFSCEESRKSERKNESDTVRHTKIISKYSPKLQSLFLTDDGILRGINFGDAIEKIQITADSSSRPIEPLEGRKGYVVSLNVFEDSDVSFYYDKSFKIIGFGIDPYLNSMEAADSLKMDFVGYFSEKYGKPLENEKNKISWKNDTLHILIEDVSIKAAPGLKVRIKR